MIFLSHEIHAPVLTAWKCVGFLGVMLFASRWGVQVWASRQAGQSVMTPLFWWLSLWGSLLCLIYFIFGKNDSVGVISYLFPAGISLYNLWLNRRRRKEFKIPLSSD